MSCSISGDTGVSMVQNGVVDTEALAPGAVTPTKESQPMTKSTLRSLTGKSYEDITGIPSWATRVTVLLDGIKLAAGGQILLQPGSGSPQTSGYTSFRQSVDTGATTAATSNGFNVNTSTTTEIAGGVLTLYNMGNNVWQGVGTYTRQDVGSAYNGHGRVTLSGALDQLRISTSVGTTFVSGSVLVIWE